MRRLRVLLLWLYACFNPEIRLPEPYRTLPGPEADAEILRRDGAVIGQDMHVALREVTKRHGLPAVQGPACPRCGGTAWLPRPYAQAAWEHAVCVGCGYLRVIAPRKEAATETQASST